MPEFIHSRPIYTDVPQLVINMKRQWLQWTWWVS